jgi:hypothetical protein
MVHSRQPQGRRKLDLAVCGGGSSPATRVLNLSHLRSLSARCTRFPGSGFAGLSPLERPDEGANLVLTDGPMVPNCPRGSADVRRPVV